MGLTLWSFGVRGGVVPGSQDFKVLDDWAAVTYPGSSRKRCTWNSSGKTIQNSRCRPVDFLCLYEIVENVRKKLKNKDI